MVGGDVIWTDTEIFISIQKVQTQKPDITMKRSHQITIKDIARELKISVATVSRALRNTYDVSKATRRKVLLKAKELNYRANFNATGLASNKSHNIAVILPTITNYYFSTVITGIQKVAYEHNYNIIFYITGESQERELSIIKELSLSSIDGLLVSVTGDSKNVRHFKRILENDIPIVFFDRAAEIKGTSKVIQNDYEGAFMAVEHLIENDYHAIALIGGPPELSFSKERKRGYLAALRKYNLPTHPEWMIHSAFNQHSGYLDTQKLLTTTPPVDAIFAVNDRKAVGAILALKEAGRRVGKEVGVIGFTNDPISTIISPTLSTMEEPALEIGMRSCALLLKQISKKNIMPEEVILQGKLYVRESTNRRTRD